MNIYDALADLRGTNEIATTDNDLITQAADRAFRVTWGVRGSRCMAPRWYDAECRRLRSQAVKAGENLASEHDKANLTAICRQYKSFKQKKKRSYRNDNIRIIEQSGNSLDFWKVLKKIVPRHSLWINLRAQSSLIISKAFATQNVGNISTIATNAKLLNF